VTKVFETGERVVRGGVPVPRALADLDADVDRILEKRRWILDRELSQAGRDAAAGR
jgi:multiple sugar transport system substrate-binding protein